MDVALVTSKNKLFDAWFLYFILITMKKYTLDELFETKKAQKMLDEWLSSYNDNDYVYAVMEINYWRYENGKDVYDFEDLENAISDVENWKVQCYHCMDCYYDSVDDLLDFGGNDFMERYFDYDSYHQDCEYDVTEASNWVVIWNW